MKCLNLSTIHCICYIICKLTFDFHFFFFLITEKNLLHAIVRKNVFQKFSAILREGGTFIISNFKVIMINKYYRLVSNDLNIISLLTTSAKENAMKKVNSYLCMPLNLQHMIVSTVV